MLEFGDPRLPQRFWDKVYPEPNTGCWLWGAAIDGNGRGQFVVRGHKRMVHRLMAEVAYGHSTAQVNHHCDVPSCVNPAHLYYGDQFDNMRDCIGRGRHANANKTHCKRGHAYTPDNTHVKPSGSRECRQCRREYLRAYKPAWRARQRAAGMRAA